MEFQLLDRMNFQRFAGLKNKARVPDRNTIYQAIEPARAHVAAGRRRWYVELDLEKFFDRVNHDVLILLNELDRKLERRGHRFVRYADDANIYVRSCRAGERVLAGVERFLNRRLKLALNREMSRVARPWVCNYLSDGMSWHRQARLEVASMSLNRLRYRLKELLQGAQGCKMATIIERINPVLCG